METKCNVGPNVKKIRTLEDTVEFMMSSDYKKRFVGEYLQTKIRYEKLKAYNTKIAAAEMCMKVTAPPHDCPYHLLRDQQSAMGEYLCMLEIRAVIEGINLEDYK